jgi:hypothetical protein
MERCNVVTREAFIQPQFNQKKEKVTKDETRKNYGSSIGYRSSGKQHGTGNPDIANLDTLH